MRIIDLFARSILVFFISLYQKYISPVKGFRCAHHALHKGESCSQFVKRSLLEHDLATAIKASQQRFNDCGSAAFHLSKVKPEHNSVLDAKVKLELPRLRGRRYFLLVAVPAFAIGLASPALASRSSRGMASCASRSAREGYRQDSEDGDCGDPNIWYGLCCLFSIGSAMSEGNN